MINEQLGDSSSALRGPVQAEGAIEDAARRRDPEAWSSIYREHYARLFRYALARVGDRETAEDLASVVFLEALKSIGSYRDRGRPFESWLFAVARNVVNQHHRKSSRAAARRLGGDDRFLTGAAGASQIDERLDLRDAVAGLPPAQRDVIILHYYAGLTIPEVARLIDKKERATYSLLTRGIQGIRRRLERGPGIFRPGANSPGQPLQLDITDRRKEGPDGP